jgi:hypothetical protein
VSFLLVWRYATTNSGSLAVQNFYDCATQDALSSRVGASGYQIALVDNLGDFFSASR